MLERLRLNEAQYRAVTAPEGHLLINAAAGTGKTHTLAARALYLQETCDTAQIMALSFSRAARGQLSERMQNYSRLYGGGNPVSTYTFHGLAYQAVRLGAQNDETWLRRNFTIVDSGTRGSPNALFVAHKAYLLKGVETHFENDDSALLLCSRAIDLLRQKGYTSPGKLPRGKFFPTPGESQAKVKVPTDDIALVWERYRKVLEQENTLDYAGLLAEASAILRRPGSKTQQRLAGGLKFLLVDEFQDTSQAMMDIIVSLIGTRVYVNAVGDSDQTIYGFNGSEVRNILGFQEYMKDTGLPVLEPVNLVENYRSAPNILVVANRALGRMNRPLVKKLVPATEALPEPVQSWRDENLQVTLVYAPRLDLAADFVVAEVNRLTHESGVRPSEIAVLVRKNSSTNPLAAQADAVRQRFAEQGIGVAVESQDTQKEIAAVEAVLKLCGTPDYRSQSVQALIDMVESGLCDDDLAGEDRKAIVELLRDTLKAGVKDVWDVPEHLVDPISEDTIAPAQGGGVQVRTVHSAKGTEFRVVFLMYLADTQFPHGKFPDLEEERRLLYVGVTRAQERLYVLGQPGTRNASFFDDLLGEATRRIDWSVQGGAELAVEGPTDYEWQLKVAEAERQQALADKEQQEVLWRLFDTEADDDNSRT